MCWVRQMSLTLGLLSNLWNGVTIDQCKERLLSGYYLEGPFLFNESDENTSLSRMQVSPSGNTIMEEKSQSLWFYNVPEAFDKKLTQNYSLEVVRTMNTVERVNDIDWSLWAAPSFVTDDEIAFWDDRQAVSYYVLLNIQTNQKKHLCVTLPPHEKDYWDTFSNYDSHGLQALASPQGCIKVVNTLNKEEVMFTKGQGRINRLYIQYPNNYVFPLLLTLGEGGIQHWDINIAVPLKTYSHPTASIIKPQGDNLIVSMSDKEIKLWDTRAGHVTYNVTNDDEKIRNWSLTILPFSSPYMVIGGEERDRGANFSLLDIRNGKKNLLGIVNLGVHDKIETIDAQYIPHKKWLVTGTSYDAWMGGAGSTVVKGFLPLEDTIKDITI